MPFVDGGRGPEGYDCWGLVLTVGNRLGLALPDWDILPEQKNLVAATVLAERQAARWVEVSEPRDGDVAVMQAGHVGIRLRGGILHAERPRVRFEDNPVMIRRRWPKLKWYRYVG